MQWLNILIGAAMLLSGRKLFWLFVGCVGFIAGAEFAGQILQGQPEWLILLIALGVGVLGAIVSIFLQRIVVVIAGFFAGGYSLSALAPAVFPAKGEAVLWIAFVAGGLLGAILSAALLEPALIVLSSLAGATAISQNVPLNPSARALLFIVLLIIGIAVQAGQYARETEPPQRSRRTERNNSAR